MSQSKTTALVLVKPDQGDEAAKRQKRKDAAAKAVATRQLRAKMRSGKLLEEQKAQRNATEFNEFDAVKVYVRCKYEDAKKFKRAAVEVVLRLAGFETRPLNECSEIAVETQLAISPRSLRWDTIGEAERDLQAVAGVSVYCDWSGYAERKTL